MLFQVTLFHNPEFLQLRYPSDVVIQPPSEGFQARRNTLNNVCGGIILIQPSLLGSQVYRIFNLGLLSVLPLTIK